MEDLTKRILHYLQKRHRIQILMYMYESGESTIQWKNVKAAFQVADVTFRDACDELIELGLVVKVPLDAFRNAFTLTDFGCLVASLITEKVQDLDTLVGRKPEVLSIM